MTINEQFIEFAKQKGYPHRFILDGDGYIICTKHPYKLIPYIALTSTRKNKIIVFESYVGRYSISFTEL